MNNGADPALVASQSSHVSLSRPSGFDPGEVECHGLDTPERVCFYEQDFYVLSNFSSFEVEWASEGVFKTSEHLYHWLRFAIQDGFFRGELPEVEAVADSVRKARSAHDAFKIAQESKHLQRPNWDDVKCDMMLKVLRAKAQQHEYVRRKLLATGDRELVENSWRDDFWGWGPNRDGQNMLGKLWMQVRSEIARIEARSDATPKSDAAEGESRNSSKTCRENGNG